MTNKPHLLLTDDQITIIFDDMVPHNLQSDHPNYRKLLDAIKARDYDLARQVVTMQGFVAGQLTENFAVDDQGNFSYKGELLHTTTARRLQQAIKKGADPQVLANFLERLYKNPSRTAIQELYLFMESGHIPLAEDGRLIAYKVVRDNYFDKHSGKFSNHVGAVLEMPRNEVDDQRNNTCSAGFHFAALDYATKYFYSPGDRMMLVAVDPADVVSIPSDYNNTKGRTWRYEVIGEVKAENLRQYEGIQSEVYNTADPDAPDQEEDAWEQSDWDEWGSYEDEDDIPY